MATETGVIKSIAPARTSAEIIDDITRSIVPTTDVPKDLEVEDGVSFEKDGTDAKKVKELTKVKVKGTLTDDETKMLQALVRSINKRGGGGGIKIDVKTKS